MNSLISFLFTNKSLAIIFLMVIAIVSELFYIKLCKAELLVALSQKETVETKLKVAENSVKDLQDNINKQNTAIEKLKADATAREESHKEEITKANIRAANYKKQAEELMKKKPPQNKSKCDAANDLINSEVSSVK